MLRDDIPLHFPCGASFAEMKTIDDRKRLCAACDTVVHDLSSMREDEARALMASRETARLCVRYLYDARTGRVAFAGDHDTRAQIIPAHSLTAKMKRRLARAAVLAAPLVLLEACGGNAGYGYESAHGAQDDAGATATPTDPGRVVADPTVSDGGAKDGAPDAADAGSD